MAVLSPSTDTTTQQTWPIPGSPDSNVADAGGDTPMTVPVDDSYTLDSALSPAYPAFPEEDPEEIISYGQMDFRVSNLSVPAGTKIYSDFITVGPCRWRFMVFPHGQESSSSSIGTFIEYDASEHPVDFSVCARIRVSLVTTNGAEELTKTSNHRFVSKESDWGFRNQASLKELIENANIYFTDGAVTLRAHVLVVRGRGHEWSLAEEYDAKAATGCVGLKNQGATCYMNSVLQSLFHTPLLRKAVFQMPTQEDDASSIPLALQRVFYELQTSNEPVSTTQLTKSFGWTSLEAFMQHDVEEFLRKLLDNMDGKMKGTPAEGVVDQLFSGKTKTYIKCIDVDYESSRIENFLDIHLNVKGCKDLHASFKEFVEIEKLEGENKYHAESYGQQDANKGDIFISFPPVLHLNLKRFEYDFVRDMQLKINSRHEYPEHINLDAYLAAPEITPADYTLHGVLVHAGDVGGGHYICFIKPTKGGGWMRFDDDNVTLASRKEVFEANFGVNPETLELARQGVGRREGWNARLRASYMNAYMLVYVRDNFVDSVLAPVGPNDVPDALLAHFRQEREAEENRERVRKLKESSVNFWVSTDESLRAHSGLDLLPSDNSGSVGTLIQTPRSEGWEGVLRYVADILHVSPERVQLLKFVNRQNNTVRPDAMPMYVPGGNIRNEPLSLSNILIQRTPLPDHHTSSSDIKFYARVVPDNDPVSTADMRIFFLKRFEAHRQRMEYLCSVAVSSDSYVRDILKRAAEITGIAELASPETKVVEEIHPALTEAVDQNVLLNAGELGTGDILCVQTPEIVDKTTVIPDAKAYIDWLHDNITVIFSPISNIDCLNDGEDHDNKINVAAQRNMPFSDLLVELGTRLALPANRLQISLRERNYSYGYTCANLRNSRNEYKSVSLAPWSSLCHMSVNEALMSTKHSNLSSQQEVWCYYELLQVSLEEMDLSHVVPILWVNSLNYTESRVINVVVRRGVTVAVALRQMTESGVIPTRVDRGSSGHFRLWKMDGHRDIIPLSNAELFDRSINTLFRTETGPQIRIEEVPLEELNPASEDQSIIVFHIENGSVQRSHGLPFLFLLHRHEPLAAVRARIKDIFAVSDDAFRKWKIGTYNDLDADDHVEFLPDESVLNFKSELSKDVRLVLDHYNRNSNSSRTDLNLVIGGTR